MQLLSIENLGKTLGDKELFAGVTFGIESGRKIALIGTNGSGKSTLLGILAGLDDEYAGTVARNRSLAVSMLRQTPRFDPEATILEYVLAGDAGRAALLRDYERCLLDPAVGAPGPAQDRLARVMREMDACDAWSYESEFSSVLGELDIHDLGRKMGELSGGMVRKVDLARALVEDAALLLLDEPTNHLDIATIVWLQDYLARTAKAVVLVTHDRYFLDAVAGTIFEIEDGKVYRYDGNYSYYMEKKCERELAMARDQERLRNVLRRELAWLRRGAKARSTKQKARIDRAAGLAARVTADGEEGAAFEVGYRRLGNTILELDGVGKSYDGRRVLSPFTRICRRGERLGLVGPNGSGKTTLLRLMTGAIVPDCGTVTIGQNTRFGIFDQTSAGLDSEARVLDFLEEEASLIRRADGAVLSAGQLLESFLFPKRMFYEKIGKLSGGERRRLQLIRVLLPDPNFLVFDEPTNDLDIATLSLLEEFLGEFGGCVAVVSHDRYFLDRVARTLLVFDGAGGVEEYAGNYSDWLETRAAAPASSVPAPVRATVAKGTAGTRRGLTFNEKKELERLLVSIDALESEKSALELLFAGGESDRERIAGAAVRYGEVQTAIATQTERWAELAAREEDARRERES